MRGIAQSGSHSIAYRVWGDGPDALILVVGLGGRSVDWGEHFVEALARSRTVITFDNRGTGDSSKPSDWWTLEDMAGDVLAVLDALELPSAHVFGHSMGGMISQLVALDHPQRVQKLVLVSTSFGGADVVHPGPEIVRILQPARGTAVDEIMREALGAITAPGFAAEHPDAIERLVANAVAAPTSRMAFSAQLSALLSSDRSARVAQITSPTLVVHGDADPLIPVENGVRLASRIPRARLEILPGIGHMPTWEAPERLGALIDEFLKS